MGRRPQLFPLHLKVGIGHGIPALCFTLGSGLNRSPREEEPCHLLLRPPTNSQRWASFWQASLYYYCENGNLMCSTQKEPCLRLCPLGLPTVKVEYWEPSTFYKVVKAERLKVSSSGEILLPADLDRTLAGSRMACPSFASRSKESRVSVPLRTKYQPHTSRAQYAKLNPNS